MIATLPYYGIRHPYNPAFYLRPQYFEAISKALESDSNQGLPIVALVGPGGCGKTQVAINYAHLTCSYDVVLWCAAGNRASVSESYFSHARVLGLIGKDEVLPEDHVIRLLRKWLVTCSTSGNLTKWLIIFDDMDQFEDIADYWPTGASGSILITSRNQRFTKVDIELLIPMSGLDSADAQRFLLSSYPRKDKLGIKESRAAALIAEKLGFLPLALDQARRHVFSSHSSYVQFLDEFMHYSDTARQHRGYHSTLSSAFTLAISRISKNALLILHLLSILNPDYIPLTFFGSDESRFQCPQLTTAYRLFNDPNLVDEVPELQDWLENPFQQVDEYCKTLSFKRGVF
ncbi:NB-ARC and TPR domain protein [Fusarium austroafricanum]|uniref:NB-ARC and TPR domain protein n=1 Tax=Fusarium austroafricanum TaxID=2364996 RepID=A0A8H4KXX4_9HYPO|nr:NB-ARC and TPR domain protein [Fusarium austroafricanum]